MKTIDLTESYIRHVLGDNDLAAYEQEMPELFRHYFTFWGERKSFRPMLKDAAAVQEKRDLVQSRFLEIERRLQSAGLNTSGFTTVLLVGQQCTNGHAFRQEDRFIVWLPIEAYNTTQEVDIFITHEIVHALHYTAVPDFYFTTKQEKDNTLRQLVTEGIATYVSETAWGVDEATALWANSIPVDARQHWMAQCAGRLKELCWFSLAHINESSAGFFQANNPSDIFSYRAGYYVGLQIIKQAVRQMQLTPSQLLQISKTKWKEFVLQGLQRCA
ncbi:hypothetical protein HYW32_04505 [Candidatus Berkelbacteria bacterium]|nr:hypothetical protein [Candidatus Berkelbacteria bacterium]